MVVCHLYSISLVGVQEFKTPVVKNTIFPKWNFFCEVCVLIDFSAACLKIMIFYY